MYGEAKEETVVVVDYVTREDLRYNMDNVNDRINDLRKKLKLLVRLLVDKKIIGEELAKSFEETMPSDILKWYLKDIKEGEKSA